MDMVVPCCTMLHTEVRIIPTASAEGTAVAGSSPRACGPSGTPWANARPAPGSRTPEADWTGEEVFNHHLIIKNEDIRCKHVKTTRDGVYENGNSYLNCNKLAALTKPNN